MKEIIENLKMEDWIESYYVVVGFNPRKKHFKTMYTDEKKVSEDMLKSEGCIDYRYWENNHTIALKNEIILWKQDIMNRYGCTIVETPSKEDYNIITSSGVNLYNLL